METELFLNSVLCSDGSYCLFASNLKANKITQKFFDNTTDLIATAYRLDSEGWDTYFALSTFITSESRTSSNVHKLKSFFVDLDCGPSKDYESQEEALLSLKDFCIAKGVPKPTILNSGRGIHAYWPLEEAVLPEEWLPVARSFKEVLSRNKVYADPAVTADTARVLRIPLTHNHKTTPPTLVKLISKFAEPLSFDTFSRFFGVEQTPIPRAKGSPKSAVMDALLGSRESRFIDIIKKTNAGSGCEQLSLIMTDQENTSEPMWRAGLSIARFCSDGDKAARKLSKKHPNYSEEETVKKYGPIKGPYTCAKFDEFSPDICPSCPNWGKVKSPIVLGNGFKEAETSSSIPDYPPPYFRGANGGVFLRSSTAEGDVDEKLIYHNDLYVVKRIHDPELGESAVMRLHLPRDGVREFTIPLAAITSREEFRKVVASQGVAVTKMDDLMSYTTSWINELQANSVAQDAHRQFGWTSPKMEAFVLGNQKITADSIEFNPPSNNTIGLFDAFEPKGSLEEWKETIDFWNKDGLELYQYVLGTGFGSVLMEFFNANCAVMHLHNLDSGVAKTTAMIAATGIWGNPERLIMDKEDTFLSKMNRGEIYHSLPWCIDEITNLTPKQASDLIYQFTSGKQRARMASSSNVERFRGHAWSLLSNTTGNASIIERVSMAKAMPKAEAQRVLECYVPNVKHLFDSIEETYEFEGAVKYKQFGTAGIPFIQYIMNHLEEAEALTKQVKKYVDKEGVLSQENRFWSAHIAATMSGLILAKHAGLHNFPIKKIFNWVIEVLLPQNKRNTETSDASVFDIMNDFFSEHISNILQIESTQDLRKMHGNGLDDLVIPDVMARGKLVARYEPDTKKFYVVPKILKNWCGELQINYGYLVKQIKEHCDGKREKVRLGKGTKLVLPAADVLVMKFDLDEDEEPRDTTSV